MGSRVDNSCPITPAYDPSIFEQQPANTTPVAPSCPISESQPGAGSDSNGQAGATKAAQSPTLPAHPATDPLVKSALGPILDIKDPKALAFAKEMLERQSEPPDVQFIRAEFGDEAAEAYKAMTKDLSDAHQAFQATGKILPTKFPFSEVEIREGHMMSRSERYDAMLKKQGKDFATMGDVVDDNRFPDYLTKQEFKDELMERHQKDRDQCDKDHWFRGPTYHCQDEVDKKYGGPGFRTWQEQQYDELRARIQQAQAKIDNIVNSGPVSLAGRGLGYAAGYAIAGKEGAEYGADLGGAIGGLGDAGLPIIAGRSEMARAQAYQGSGGLEVRREAPVHIETVPGNNPSETQPGSAHERYADPKNQSVEVQNNKPVGAAGSPPEPPKSPSSVPRELVDTNTAIYLDKARQKAANGQPLTLSDQRLLNEFKDKDVWVSHFANTELDFRKETREQPKVATDVKPSTKQERDAIDNDLRTASVGGGDVKGESDRTQVRQVLLTAAPAGKANTFSTADTGVINGLFRLARIPDPRPGHTGEFLEPGKLDAKNVRDFLHDVLRQDSFDITVQGHRLTVRPL